MIFDETYTLANGVKIPKLGLGTWLIDNERAAQAVRDAVAAGYRHIDTAQAYDNEEGIGEGVRTCGVPREKLFLTTKVAAEAKSYRSAADSIDVSLRKLGSEYIDLIIIHSPQPWMEVNQSSNRYFAENREVWRALEDACEAGKLRAIGVSNFLREDLENLLSACRTVPMVDQMLAHISNTPLELISFCKSKGILAEAYSPIAHDPRPVYRRGRPVAGADAQSCRSVRGCQGRGLVRRIRGDGLYLRHRERNLRRGLYPQRHHHPPAGRGHELSCKNRAEREQAVALQRETLRKGGMPSCL